MEIRVEQLRNALEIVKPAVPRKPTLDILKNVLAKDGQLMATDMESMVIVGVPEVDESFLLPYAEVLKMLKYVSGYEKLEIHAKRGKLTMAWSDGEATYPSQSVGDFPAIVDFKAKDEADIDGDTFISALSSALPYVATASDRPILNGVTVQFGRPIEISAGDGSRMAHIVLPFEFPEEYTTVLPASSIVTLAHVMEKTPRTPPRAEALMDIVLAKRQIRVGLDGKRGLSVGFGSDVSVIIKLVEGKPPAWLKLIPKDDPILKAQFFARELETAVRRVSDVAHQSKGIVRFQFQDGAAKVSARADGREVSAKVSVLDLQGAPNRLALNVVYLTEYLKDKDGIVTMLWTGGTAPASFQHSKSPKVLIMPMQVEWDEPLPATQVEPEAEAKTAKPQRKSRKGGKS